MIQTLKGNMILDQNNCDQLNESDFKKIAKYMENKIGIKMPDNKRVMMQSRLMHRLRELGISNFSDYTNYVFNKDETGKELILMTDALTTNKTEFFRESDHFNYLTSSVLPQYAKDDRQSINIWSAGCSSGEEPYTICMVLKEYSKQNPGSLAAFNVVATDISTKVLKKAVNAVYDSSETDNMPLELKKRYFLKSIKNTKQVRVKPEIRSLVSFKRLNFMDDLYDIDKIFKIIFCRNVLIYFEKSVQEQIISKFMRFLEPGGYLFLGHSETILSTTLPVTSVFPSVYKKEGGKQYK